MLPRPLLLALPGGSGAIPRPPICFSSRLLGYGGGEPALPRLCLYSPSFFPVSPGAPKLLQNFFHNYIFCPCLCRFDLCRSRSQCPSSCHIHPLCMWSRPPFRAEGGGVTKLFRRPSLGDQRAIWTGEELCRSITLKGNAWC